MPRLLLGCISLCMDGDPRNESRIKTHQIQLRWLENIGFTDYIYYRVEQAYTPQFREAVATTLDLQPLIYDKGLGPSAARNVLLKKLYESDSDWLVCMDDDRILYSHYGADAFLRDLAKNPATIKLAEKGVLIVGVCPARRPFKKANADFEKAGVYSIATHWNLVKGCLDGCLQICCIPNLVKYGYEPIWFDETNDCIHTLIPEDMQFEVHWILNKHPFASNLMMIVKELVEQQAQNVSTIYKTNEERQKIDKENFDFDKYVRQVTHNRIKTLADLNKIKNGFKPIGILRLDSYTPVQSDYGRYKTI